MPEAFFVPVPKPLMYQPATKHFSKFALAESCLHTHFFYFDDNYFQLLFLKDSVRHYLPIYKFCIPKESLLSSSLLKKTRSLLAFRLLYS